MEERGSMKKPLIGFIAGVVVGVTLTLVKIMIDLNEIEENTANASTEQDGKVRVNAIDVNVPQDKINDFVSEITKLANSVATKGTNE